jgi:hypothetical protein
VSDSLRIVVLGLIVRYPLGGMAWHYLQYVMGLEGLGHDVYFFEDSGDWPECYDPRTLRCTTDPAYGLEFARSSFERVGLSDRWAYYDAHTREWCGPCGRRADEIGASADLVLNVSGTWRALSARLVQIGTTLPLIARGVATVSC